MHQFCHYFQEWKNNYLYRIFWECPNCSIYCSWRRYQNKVPKGKKNTPNFGLAERPPKALKPFITLKRGPLKHGHKLNCPSIRYCFDTKLSKEKQVWSLQMNPFIEVASAILMHFWYFYSWHFPILIFKSNFRNLNKQGWLNW